MSPALSTIPCQPHPACSYFSGSANSGSTALNNLQFISQWLPSYLAGLALHACTIQSLPKVTLQMLLELSLFYRRGAQGTEGLAAYPEQSQKSTQACVKPKHHPPTTPHLSDVTLCRVRDPVSFTFLC